MNRVLFVSTVFALTLITFNAGCECDAAPEGGACAGDEDCPPDQRCDPDGAICVDDERQTDAGVDAGVGGEDAGVVDGGVDVDAGVEEDDCGDGIINGDEACDDDNDNPGDGCAACVISAGFACIGAPSVCHAIACGDGIVDGSEACDDDNDDPDDGCDGCVVSDGFACIGSPSVCHPTVCGDLVIEGAESCDDGNALIGDGCANCQLEPVCAGGVCDPVCGDGAVFEGEACDDGNRIAGDGCSADCLTVEAGFVCTLIQEDPPATVAIPIVYRDFRGRDLEGGHCDFQRSATNAGCGADGSGSETGIAADTWDPVTRKPRYARDSGRSTSTTSAALFTTWYESVDGQNITVAGSLDLDRQADGTYVFENRSFFPLDGIGFVGAGTEQPRDNGHNFHFTSELRFWFTYDGNPINLQFFGDDDVFVFINGHLAVDIGGIHGPIDREVTIDGGNEATFEMTAGGVYEAAVFQAERQTSGSQYKLTLAGFFPPKSRCAGECGDGVRVGDEACDLGAADNVGGYNGCNADCTPGPFCGDGVISDDEVCDDGANNGRTDFCSTTCRGLAAQCGNGVVDDGEVCDDGVNDGGYDGCQPGCQARGPFCGDGLVQGPEQCDDGDQVNNNSCSNACVVVIGG